MTSSPGCPPQRQQCSAVVPLEQVTACLVSQKPAKAPSNPVTYLPSEETQLVSTQSVMYFGRKRSRGQHKKYLPAHSYVA